MNTRMLCLGGVLCCLPLACSSSISPTPDGGTAGTPTPTPLAEKALTDSSGKVLAQAAQEHALTPQEVKIVAAFWTYRLEAQITGQMDPDFLNSNLTSEVNQIALEYPSFFVANPAGGVAVAEQAVVASAADFSCTNNCWPSPSIFTEAPNLALNALAGPGGAGLAEVIDNAYKTLQAAVAALEAAGVSVPAAVDQAVSEGDGESATTMLSQLAAAISTVGALAGAVAAAGVGGATAVAVAGVCAELGAELVADLEIGESAFAAALTVACNVWKASRCCGSPPVECPANQSCCNSVCTDESSDPQNCGRCGRVCLSPAAGGFGSSCCFSVCTDEQSDSLNCGSCGHDCDEEGPGLMCEGGTCNDCKTSPVSCYAAPDSTQSGTCDFSTQYPSDEVSAFAGQCTANQEVSGNECPTPGPYGGCCYTSPDAGACPGGPPSYQGDCYYDGVDDTDPSAFLALITAQCAMTPGAMFSAYPP